MTENEQYLSFIDVSAVIQIPSRLKKKIKGLSGPYLPQEKMIWVSHVTNLLFKDLILLCARVHSGRKQASAHYSFSVGFLSMGLLIKGVGAASWFSLSHQT